MDISKKVFWVWGLGFAVRIRFYDPSIGVVHRFCLLGGVRVSRVFLQHAYGDHRVYGLG